jgi:hypothetical protein
MKALTVAELKTHFSDVLAQIKNGENVIWQIKNKVTIAKELHKTFYGSTDFAIEDCNGYILTFSQQA